MKINKNVLENNLYNLLKNKKTKSQKNINDKNLFSSLLGKSEQFINREDLDSLFSEEQKSIESLYGKGKGTTSPSSHGERKVNYISSFKKKKIKIKCKRKSHKKKSSLIKILNKPFCFISSKNDNNINLINGYKFNMNQNFSFRNDSKLENKRYNNINIINNSRIEKKKSDKFVNYDLNKINRAKSGMMKINIPNCNNKKSELHLTKNRSANNVVNRLDYNNNELQSSVYQFKLNLLRSKISKLNSNFSIYHFLKSNNIYIFIKNSQYTKENEILCSQNNANIESKIYEIEDDFFLPPAYAPE
jgi:hypothetical protein